MPILRPHAARFHERRISSVAVTSAHLYGNAYMRVGVARVQADSSDFGFLGEQSSPKWEIPEPPCIIWHVGGEICKRTNTQNTQTNSNRYMHTLPIGMCG